MRNGLVVIALALAACGDVKQSNPDAGPLPVDIGLSVDQSSVAMAIASSTEITVSVQRTGPIGDIELTVATPANLTARFASATLSAGEDTTTLNIAAIGGIAAAIGDVTITASSGVVERTATITVSTTTITVSGTVRGARSDVTVVMVGRPAITSGTDGAFSFTDVVPPYDLYTFGSEGTSISSQPAIHYYDDLTTTQPYITAPITTTPVFSLLRTATVNGMKLGSGDSVSPIVYAWSLGGFTTTVNTPVFSLLARWSGISTTINGSIFALQFTRKPSGGPDNFLGFGSQPLTVTSGGTHTADVGLAAVGSAATVTGAVTQPAGYAAPTLQLTQGFGTGYAPLWTSNATTTVDANFPLLPAVGGANIYATSALGDALSSYVYPLTVSADVSFAMPAAATLGAPADAAVGVSTTSTFSWTSPSTVVNHVTFVSPSARFHVYTTKQETTIPQVAELALPAATNFSWTIEGLGPATSIDDVAKLSELRRPVENDFTGPPRSYTSTSTRTFTTP